MTYLSSCDIFWKPYYIITLKSTKSTPKRWYILPFGADCTKIGLKSQGSKFVLVQFQYSGLFKNSLKLGLITLFSYLLFIIIIGVDFCSFIKPSFS